MYIPLTSSFFFGILFTICIIHDSWSGIDAKKLYEYSKSIENRSGLSSVERYKSTSKERLDLVCFYESEMGQAIYSQRKI